MLIDSNTQSMQRSMSKKSSNGPDDTKMDHQQSRKGMKAALRKRDATKLFTYFAMKRSIKWYVELLFTFDKSITIYVSK